MRLVKHLSILLALSFMASPAMAQDDDIVGRALKDELKRNITRLKLDQYKGPYFGSYCIDQIDTVHVAASFGALDSSYHSRSRNLNVVMREGDYALDSSNMGAGGAISSLFGGSFGSAITCDDNYDAIRHELWLKSDEAYKKAIEDLAAKKAYLVENNVKDLPESMSKETPVVVIQDTCAVTSDNKKLGDLVTRLSAIFKSYPKVQKSSVSINEDAISRWFANSEGFYHRVPYKSCRLVISASGQAADGSAIADSEKILAFSAEQLPAPAALESAVNKLAERVTLLTEAKEIEEYRGPILFEGRAAASFFADALQPHLGHKASALGKFSALDSLNRNPLEEKLGTRILPTFISVVDDPLTRQFGETPILSSYVVDDEGVKAEKITLVDKGILKTFAMSRVPSKAIKHSNGHANGINGAAQNLYIQSDSKLSFAQLRERLIAMGKEEGLKNVLIVRRLGSGGSSQSLLSSMLGMFGKGGDVTLSPPVELVSVSIADGHEELVRGGQFGNLNLRVLRDIEATADDMKAYAVTPSNSLDIVGFSSPTSVTTPSLLIKEIEMQKPSKQTDLLPVLKNPYFEH